MQWESPPCWADEGDNDTAAKLLRQMLDLGISRWHPSPMSAMKRRSGKCGMILSAINCLW